MSQTPSELAKIKQVHGAARYRAGDISGAIAALTEAADLSPTDPAYLLNLSELARISGRPDAARDYVARAAALTPPHATALSLLAAAWLDVGDAERALDVTIAALDAEETAESRQLFAESVKRAGPRPAVRARLAQALQEGWARADGLAAPALRLLRAAWPNSPAALVADPLLSACLTSILIRDTALEERLVALRRGILLHGASPTALPFVARLAVQCHLNEYAWAIDDIEYTAAQALAARLPSLSPVELATLASYRSLGSLPEPQALLDAEWPPDIDMVIREQITAPSLERAISDTLPTLTVVREGVSTQVRELYEENPYPRWTRIPQTTPAPLASVLRAALPGVRLDPPPPASPDVLIAGCGTGQHAIQAAQYADARILAVDLSRASLSYAVRKAREAGLDQIDFAQADLLELGAASRTFDVIECSGVLHHLAEPSAGARVLASLLRPGGFMKLGLYSASARKPLDAAKRLAARYPATTEGIRRLRSAIMAAPADDPVRTATALTDFFAISPCRDLLKHVQEHELTLGQIKTMLSEIDLRFLGFTNPPGIVAAYRARFPGGDPADLDNWATFEAERPLTFIGMYQFWVQKPG